MMEHSSKGRQVAHQKIQQSPTGHYLEQFGGSISKHDGLWSTVDMHGNPMYYTVAIKTDADHWQPAMEEEMKSLHEHNVWNLINLPEGRDTIKCKWVYFIKRNTDNRPTRYKAWLVTKGFSQVYGIDYKETFAPVARLDSLQLLLNLTAI
jgi:hypothetical protein